jgi:hypothetical protein
LDACDSSPNQHASKHSAATKHPVIASFEPGEDWFFDCEKQRIIKGVELLPPHSHPATQPAPGPTGRVPPDWESIQQKNLRVKYTRGALAKTGIETKAMSVGGSGP